MRFRAAPCWATLLLLGLVDCIVPTPAPDRLTAAVVRDLALRRDGSLASREMQTELARRYAQGYGGVLRNESQATQWYLEAAKGCLFENAFGPNEKSSHCDQASAEALTDLAKRVEQKYGNHELILAILVEGKESDGQNLATAVTLYREAAQLGNVEAQNAMVTLN